MRRLASQVPAAGKIALSSAQPRAGAGGPQLHRHVLTSLVVHCQEVAQRRTSCARRTVTRPPSASQLEEAARNASGARAGALLLEPKWLRTLAT
mmetsp:Transcript_219/g.122  ORF Transcript_219/g.122 Transcript_219/m.122 type:complete len:94 (-) Transcript_219:10-291(-)